MLRVHPGRIDVTKMSTNGENSKLAHAWDPKLSRTPMLSRPKKQKVEIIHDESKGHLAVLHEISQRLKAESARTKAKRRQNQQSPRSSELADTSECADTSAARSALDALAGVAAALADSD